MGLFDNLIAKARCPFCKKERLRDFQTKALFNMLYTFRAGQKVETYSMLIKDGLIKNCIEVCPDCDNIFYADAVIKNSRFMGVKNIRKKRKSFREPRQRFKIDTNVLKEFGKTKTHKRCL